MNDCCEFDESKFPLGFFADPPSIDETVASLAKRIQEDIDADILRDAIKDN